MKDENESGFIGFLFFTLTIILFIMKVEWYLDISWWFVFSPIWLPILIIIVVVTYFEITDTFKKKKE
jgi:putative effector of murein hydrolase